MPLLKKVEGQNVDLLFIGEVKRENKHLESVMSLFHV